MNDLFDYDFLILGGGSAGYAAARTAAALGLRTAVVDSAEKLGGLCILRGCMPSKTLLESSSRMSTLRRASEFGLRAENIAYDAEAILARKRRLIGEFADYRTEQLENGKFDLIRGAASFLDAHTLEVCLRDGSQRQITTAAGLVATGSVISRPLVEGIDNPAFWTSDDVLEAGEIPESVIVLGAGPVSLEIASYYAGLGQKTTVIQRSAQILSGTDTELANTLQKSMEAHGVRIITETKLLKAGTSSEGQWVEFEKDGQMERLHAGRVIVATGREPALGGLEPGVAGIQLDKRRIAVENTQQSSTPNWFAAGDVCGPFEVVHIAIQQGEIAARNAARFLKKLDGDMEQMDYRQKLFAVFSSPQLAVTGLSEEEAHGEGLPIKTATYPFNDHGKSIVMGETEGIVKLIAHAETGEILGGGVVGPEAAELIHEIVVAMRFRGTAKDLATTPHYHPTLSEIWTYPAEDLAEAIP